MSLKYILSKKRIVLALLMLVLVVIGGLSLGSSPKFILAMAGIFVVGALFNVRVHAEGKAAWLAYIAYIFLLLVSSAFAVIITQKINDSRIFISAHKFLLGMEVAIIFICLISLIEAVVCKRPSVWTFIIALGLLAVFALANYYLFTFRGNSLSPIDFLTIGTAVNFVGKYDYEITRFIFHGIVFYFAGAFALSGIKLDIKCRKAVRIFCPFVLVLIMFVSLSAVSSKNLVATRYHSNVGCWQNGLLLNFALEIAESFVSEPTGYSEELIKAAEEEYGSSAEAAEAVPNIIIIMNESFADQRVHGDIKTNVPVMPFFDSLSENTIKGYALSSVYGGLTPNSEFEFFTGSSIAFLPTYCVPFQQYILKPTYSLVHYLESLGYTSYATHPCDISNWNREKVYPNLGLDNYTFIEAYDSAKLLDGQVSDRSLYEHIIRKYESMEGDSNKLIYALSMQNHGPYELGDKERTTVVSEACDSLEADIYFSKILESDKAFEELLAYFEAVEEPVVVLMYGDHQPGFSNDVLEALHGGSDGSLDEQMLRYIVPFVVWTNYDIEEQQVEMSSLNFLSNYLLEAAGLPLSPYNRFLSEVQQIVPAMNAYGYYSLSDGHFKAIEEAEGQEKEILQKYAALQYNALFGKDSRSKVLFPVAE